MPTKRLHLLPAMLLLVCSAARAKEPCAVLLPASLKVALHRAYSGYRLVRVADYLAEDVEAHKKEHNGNPCLGVASADVDGNGILDFAVLLTDGKGHTLLAMARGLPKNRWVISTIWNFKSSGIQRTYVDTVPAGEYQDLFDSDRAPSEYTPEPGRVRRFTAKFPGFTAGETESSEVAYFYAKGHWVHLWLSD